jgi:hypothetical protein
MYSRQLEQLARQRGRELSEIPRSRPTATPTRASGRPARKLLRNQTGWALVSIGLRIASSGDR